MIIAVDICNTIADIICEIEKALGPNPRPSSYFHPKVTGGYFKKNLWLFAQAEPLLFSQNVLQELSKRNQLVYITARPLEAKDVTLDWLKRYGYPAADIYFTQDKVSIAKRLGVTVAIEDSPEEIQSYLNSGIEVWVKAQPYNTQYDRRFEWPEIRKGVA